MIHLTDRDKVLYSLHTIHPFYWKYTYKPQMFCSQRTHNRWTNTEEPICYQGKISEISCHKIPTLDCYNLCSLVMFTFWADWSGQHDAKENPEFGDFAIQFILWQENWRHRQQNRALVQMKIGQIGLSSPVVAHHQQVHLLMSHVLTTTHHYVRSITGNMYHYDKMTVIKMNRIMIGQGHELLRTMGLFWTANGMHFMPNPNAISTYQMFASILQQWHHHCLQRQ